MSEFEDTTGRYLVRCFMEGHSAPAFDQRFDTPEQAVIEARAHEYEDGHEIIADLLFGEVFQRDQWHRLLSGVEGGDS